MINSGIKSIESKYNNFKISSMTKLNDKNRNIDLKINTLGNNENSSPNEFSNVLKNNNILAKKDKLKTANYPTSAKHTEVNTEKKIFKTSSLCNFNTKMEKKTSIQKKIKADLEKVKISHKSYGVIEAYSAITTEGIYREYNEDRVSIIFNISKPSGFEETNDNMWPKCSFFGVYDGHGGSGCADFLRDNLHKYIVSDHNFPKNPQKAILNGFIKAEKNFMKKSFIKNSEATSSNKSILDRSGSCAIVVLIVESRCFIANVGDSRAIMSGNNGAKVYTLSRDHRPNDEKEYKRILDAGGKIYQTEANIETNSNNSKTTKNTPSTMNIIGPLRVFPGKLSVSRTIGDMEAKDPKFGGNPNVVIALPEIKYFDITCKNDFIIIGCDGLFEKLKNNEIIEKVWRIIDDDKSDLIMDIHHLNGIIGQNIIEECIAKKSTDNLTAVMICFRNDFRYSAVQTDVNYQPMTQQVNKAPKIIKHHLTEEKNNNNSNNLNEQKSILSKIIKKTQLAKYNDDNFNHK